MVVDRPVDDDVDSELIPVDAEVESEETLLLVVERPDEAEVESELMPEDADVESDPT